MGKKDKTSRDKVSIKIRTLKRNVELATLDKYERSLKHIGHQTTSESVKEAVIVLFVMGIL